MTTCKGPVSFSYFLFPVRKQTLGVRISASLEGTQFNHNSPQTCFVDYQPLPSCPHQQHRQEIEDDISGSFQIPSFPHHRGNHPLYAQSKYLGSEGLREVQRAAKASVLLSGQTLCSLWHTLLGERKTRVQAVFPPSGEATPNLLLLKTCIYVLVRSI